MAPTEERTIRIALIDDHPVLRAGLRLLIEAQPGMSVVSEAEDRAGAVPLAAQEQPDIILLDLDLGGDSGSDFIGELVAAAPRTRVVILTGVRDVLSLRRAVHKGAVGIVHKASAADVLVRAIEKVHGGEVWLDRSMMASVLTELTQRGKEKASEEPAAVPALSKREREVISILAEGLSNQAIAERLFISETTVRHHLTSIFSKLAVSDRLELLIYAYRHGLVAPPQLAAPQKAD